MCSSVLFDNLKRRENEGIIIIINNNNRPCSRCLRYFCCNRDYWLYKIESYTICRVWIPNLLLLCRIELALKTELIKYTYPNITKLMFKMNYLSNKTKIEFPALLNTLFYKMQFLFFSKYYTLSITRIRAIQICKPDPIPSKTANNTSYATSSFWKPSLSSFHKLIK